MGIAIALKNNKNNINQLKLSWIYLRDMKIITGNQSILAKTNK